MSNIQQLIASLTDDQRRNCEIIQHEIVGMAFCFGVSEMAVFDILNAAGQDVLDSLENQQGMGNYVLDRIVEKDPEFGVVADIIRESIARVGKGAPTDFLADFPIYASTIQTYLALEKAA